MKSKYKVPFCRPYITKRERRAVDSVLKSLQMGCGEEVSEFEKEFAEYVGSKYAVAVSSGTAALFLSLQAMGIKEDWNVIVPSLTFTASASVIRHSGATPVFCDVDRKTLCLDKEKVRKVKDEIRVDAAVNVYLTGNDAEDLGIPTVYDAAHYLFRNCHRGEFQTYSFHPTKNMTTGYGGMISLNSEKAYRYLLKARMHGCVKRGSEEALKGTARRWGYDVQFCGWKMNMNNIQAALGREQLKNLDYMNQGRVRCISQYNYGLGLNRVGLHLYPIFVEDREEFMEAMEEAGIQCSVHFEPLHKMTAYADLDVTEDLSNSEWIGKHIVSLPLFPKLTNKQIDYVCKKVRDSGLLISQ